MMSRVHDVHSKNEVLLKILCGFYLISLGVHFIARGDISDLPLPVSVALGSVLLLIVLGRRYPVLTMISMVCSPYVFILALSDAYLSPYSFILLSIALLVSLIYLDIRIVLFSSLLYLSTAIYWFADLRWPGMTAGYERNNMIYVAMFVLYVVVFSWGLIHFVKGRWSKSERGLTSINHILESIDITTWVYDLGSSQLILSPGIRRLTGLPAEALTDFRTLLKLVDPADIPLVLHSQKEMIMRKKEVLLESRLRHIDGEIYWVQVRGTPQLNELGHLVQLEGVIIDITDSKEREECMEYLAYHDDLTGLPNRAFFHMRLQQYINESVGSIALMFIDLDNFKSINDTYGHYAGDRLLQEIARRLSRQIRESDLICRLGGDEFLILLVNSDENLARKVAERINASLSEPFHCNEHQLYASASIGIHYSPDGCGDLEQMISKADEAMYEAKRKGRCRYSVDQSPI